MAPCKAPAPPPPWEVLEGGRGGGVKPREKTDKCKPGAYIPEAPEFIPDKCICILCAKPR